MTSSNGEASLRDTVFVVQHSYDADGCAEIKLIGIYSSRKNAEDTVKRLAGQPGFVDHPGGFTIDAYPLNADHWTEGFLRG
jgi:hypothetical protein